MVKATRDPENWRSWYQLEVWRKRRRLQLLFMPLCAECHKRGKTTPATIADHIESHHGDWNTFRLGKLQSLCSHCHESTKKVVDLRGYDPTIGPDGMPIDLRHPVYGSASAVKPASNA